MALSTLSGGDPNTHQPWPLKNFSVNPHFERINPSKLIEEEALPEYVAEEYYPARIGEVIRSRYQIVGKLGFGTTSTVWLARDMSGRRYVALKIFTYTSTLETGTTRELEAYRRLARGPPFHHGRNAIRLLLDSFTMSGPHGEHQCLVHMPLWESLKKFIARNPIGRMPKPLLALTLRQVFLALDYAQQCQVIHTDIKADNIMFNLVDSGVFEEFEDAELQHPTPRKEIGGRTIYTSRQLGIPGRNSVGAPVLCDFGSASWGEEKSVTDVQPNVYRSPEVIIKVPWSYEIDIWNVGCMIWDLFEGEHLFDGFDVEHNTYRSRAHLAEMIALLGPPPLDFISRGAERSRFFSEKGDFVAGIGVPESYTLEEIEDNLDGSDKQLFLRFMGKMLQWDPKKRHTAKQLLEDEWIVMHSVSPKPRT